MYKRSFILLFTLVFTIVVASGCSNSSNESTEESTEQNNTEEDSQEEANEEQDNSENNSHVDDNEENGIQNEDNETNDNNDESSNGESESSNDNNIDLPDTIEINDETHTDTGVSLELESISFEDDHIAIDFNAENQSGYAVTLASLGSATGDNLGGITLQDDTGYNYRYVAESEESFINLEDQEKVNATVRFIGTVRDDAKTLTLKFNPDEIDNDIAPKFSYEDIEIKW